jgi:hypothetical protein
LTLLDGRHINVGARGELALVVKVSHLLCEADVRKKKGQSRKKKRGEEKKSERAGCHKIQKITDNPDPRTR